MKKIISAILVMVVIFSVFAYSKLTLFSIQPVGALPEGATIVMWKKGKLNFIDSPDGVCLRVSGEVSLLCRAVIIGNVVDKDNIIFKLPYIKWLYLLSTNGKEFEK